jgi:extradiol dioxygenase
MQILSLGYLGFEGPRHEEWLSFGPEVVGLAPGGRGSDGAVWLKMDERNFRFSMHPGPVDRLAYVGWELRDVHAFDAALEKLNRLGVAHSLATLDERRERGVAGMVRITDPAGFVHELFYGQAFWPHSFRPGRPISGFLAGEFGLGHVVLGVPEFTDELRTFAVDVLGFQIFSAFDFPMPDGQRQRLEFYRCNPRTHVLAYVPFPGLKGVQHVGIDTLHFDDVGTCLDLCTKRKIPISMTLGRQVLDDTVSFYFLTPGGFELEYGFGPKLYREGEFILQTPQHYPHIWGHELVPEHRATTLLPVDQP